MFVFFYAPPRDGEFSLQVFVLPQGLGEYGGKLSGTRAVRERGSGTGGDDAGGTRVPE